MTAVRPSGYRLLRISVAAALVLLGLLPALLREAQTDEAWPLYLAARVLEGQRHGIDFFEMNPPLYIWLCIPAVLANNVLGLGVWQAWILLVTALALGSLVVASRCLKSADLSDSHRAGLLLSAAFVFLVLPQQHFSEREHLALILVFPFVVLVGRGVHSAPGRGLAVLAGLMAGAGFSLKPHFLVAWLLLETWLLIRGGTASLKRPELWALVSFGVVYLGAALVITPEYFPMALRLGPLYHAYLNNGLFGAIKLAGPALLLILGISVAIKVAQPTHDDLRDAFTVVLLGFFAAAILQQKGLDYHYLPSWGFGVLLLVRARQTRPARLSWYPSSILVRLGFLLGLIVVIDKGRLSVMELAEPGHLRYQPYDGYPELVRTVRQLAEGGSIVVLSTNPVGGWPLTVSADVRWASRYMHFWPMVALYDEPLWSRPPRIVEPHPLEARGPVERRFHDEIMEDLERHRPRVVAVLMPDSSQWGLGGSRRFDYLQYFAVDPRFRAFMADYREQTRIGPYQVWTRAQE